MSPQSSSGGGVRGSVRSAPTPSGFVGRYQILEQIGEGGMGSLFMARDPAIERLLAIKVLRVGYDTEELRERFAREARAAGRLRHPNIVTIFDVGEHDGAPFIAMEFLPGETLAQLIRERARLPLSRRLKLLEELCDGLGYAHRSGLVHRDIKPANLMVDSEGTLKILDFGIVRLGESGMTQAGVLVGTVNYMSPEQVMGGAVDGRSDIFSVGLVGYELFSYAQAFPGSLADGLFNRILNVALEPLASRCRDLDPAIVRIVEQAIKREPADRYQDLARMRNDLQRIRLRIEAQEEEAAQGGDPGSETIVVGPAPPGVPTPPLGTPASGSAPILAEAERALQSGNYRAALSLAGRSAVMNPSDTSASAIMERAHAALMERGRKLEADSAAIPAGAAGATPLPVRPDTAGVPRSGVETPAAPRSGSAAHGINKMAIALAVAGLLIAAIALFARRDRAPLPAANVSPIATTSAASPASHPQTPGAGDERASAQPAIEATPQPSASPPEAAAPQKGTSRESRRPAGAPIAQQPVAPQIATPPAPAPAQPAPVQPPAAARPMTLPRVGVDVAAPRRVRMVEPVYPDAARSSGVDGTVLLELTIGREGRVADARVVRSIPGLDDAALAAARQWEFMPTLVAGAPTPIVYPNVPVTFALPAAAGKPAAPAATDTQPRLPVPPRVEEHSPEPAAPRDAVADAGAIRDTLRRYEAAWEALDASALQRVQALAPDAAARVQQTMSAAQAYRLQVTDEDVEVAPGGRRATVRARVRRMFTPRIGRGSDQTVTNTFELEKRGDAWTIVAIR